MNESQWMSGSASRLHTTDPTFPSRDEQAFHPFPSLSSLQWVDKSVPGLLGNLTLEVSCENDHLTGTSAHPPQGPRPRVLSWAQQALTLMGCCATKIS
ncbi:hypothetical protein TNCV_5122921 [Trichonephila clavipes]|nr:hypothetical protein TNCV_5122921 [Trichonephila clavipes]